MHKHNDSQRPVRDLPIRARPGETVLLDSGRVFDVALAVSEILARPQQFECAEVVLSQFAGQIRGPTKLTFHYVAAMGRDDARRPLMLGRQDDGALLLLDGRHRAARSLQLGYAVISAWFLSASQVDAGGRVSRRPVSRSGCRPSRCVPGRSGPGRSS